MIIASNPKVLSKIWLILKTINMLNNWYENKPLCNYLKCLLQSKVICKYCYRWRNIGSLFRTNKNIWNRIWLIKHGRRLEVTKKLNKHKNVSFLCILLTGWYSRTNSGDEMQKWYTSVLRRCFPKEAQNISS